MPRSKTKRFGGYGYAVGHKVKPHERDCQRCGRRFKTDRIVPYCPACFQAKRAERSGGPGG
jgi:hypothetical protein